ncbi:MAG: cyclic nucleotide-binding domain-containing protein [Victivallaceae bacterium]|nr:cyclic nucleotide-binding domain-containing protein [Victivallaceae bacterium]
MSDIDVKNLAFFADIDANDAEAIQKLFYEESFLAGDTVFAEGDVGDILYLIVDGCVRISTKIGDVEKILVTLRRGAVFGELATVEEDFRSATAKAVEDSNMLAINRAAFTEMLEQHPVAGRKILGFVLATVTGRLKNTTELYRQAVDWGLSISGILELNFNQLIANNINIQVELQSGRILNGILLKADRGVSGYELLIRKADDQFVIVPYHAVVSIEFADKRQLDADKDSPKTV